MFTEMDHLAQPSFRSLQVHFYISMRLTGKAEVEY